MNNPTQIASKCIQACIDQKSKDNVTDGGYLWDLEKIIVDDIRDFALQVATEAVEECKSEIYVSNHIHESVCDKILKNIKKRLE